MRRFRSIPSDKAELLEVPSDDGLVLHLYRMHGRRDLPAVLFGHACGFAAGSYLPILERLAAVADVFAFDARGHGGSDAPAADLPVYGSSDYARDLVRLGRAVTERKDGEPIYYVGHSLGAVTMLRLGCLHPTEYASVPWRASLLFEPPIFPSPGHPLHAESADKDRRLIERTKTRRPQWPSREAFAAALAGRGIFKNIGHDLLQAHAAATLRPLPGGDGYELCCPPAVEAATFAGVGEPSTFLALDRFPDDIPVHLVGGDVTDPERSWVTLMAPVVAERLGAPSAGRRFTALPGRGHLMVLEDPEMTHKLIHSLISGS